MIANAPTSMTPMVVAPVCGSWVMLSMFFTTAVGVLALASALVTLPVSPGWSLPALQYIYEERNAAANGHETLDTDASAEAAKAGDLACERYVLGKGKLQIEVLQNLDRVAPAGALLVAAWPRIEGATGLPARVLAITPKK